MTAPKRMPRARTVRPQGFLSMGGGMRELELAGVHLLSHGGVSSLGRVRGQGSWGLEEMERFVTAAVGNATRNPQSQIPDS